MRLYIKVLISRNVKKIRHPKEYRILVDQGSDKITWFSLQVSSLLQVLSLPILLRLCNSDKNDFAGLSLTVTAQAFSHGFYPEMKNNAVYDYDINVFIYF